jgi:amidophosphoribosyltransferase
MACAISTVQASAAAIDMRESLTVCRSHAWHARGYARPSVSDFIGHKCGVVLLRLKRPLEQLRERRGDMLWGLRRLYLLMEKQRNRGQDGAGIAAVKFDMPAGEPFLLRLRNAKRNALERLFDEAMEPATDLSSATMRSAHPIELKRRIPLLGEAMLGHLRYGTYGGRGAAFCHPYIRRSVVASRNLALAGNFNLTNSNQLFRTLVELGLNPVGDTDTGVVLEKMGHFLDQEHRHLSATIGPGSFRSLSGTDLAQAISQELDLHRVLRKATEDFDGGFAFVGLVGNGDAFACRDRHGIRPAFVAETEDVVAVASERAALTTVLDLDPSLVRELPPAHALVIRRDGEVLEAPFAEPGPCRSCTFERIYFSRGNDPQIHQERMQLGRNLAGRVLEVLGGGIERAVFGFIPNTSETAYMGLVDEVGRRVRLARATELAERLHHGTLTAGEIEAALGLSVRAEKVAHKDQKLRTFITHDAARGDLVKHVYDVTPGVVRPDDTLVMVDDSIVRGTTLRESIVTMLARLQPTRIVIVSSSPPIRYPDCYGIDMSQLGRFIAFEATIAVLRARGDQGLIDEVERLCLEQQHWSDGRQVNHVRRLYDAVDHAELEGAVAQGILPPGLAWKGGLQVVYQSLDGLRQAMPEHAGTWYFDGDYPTPGGYRVLNTAFLQWCRREDGRAY